MQDSTNLINITIDWSKHNISLTFNWFLGSLGIAAVVIPFMRHWLRKRKSAIHQDIVPVELTLTMGKSNVKYAIVRNYLNLEIAHRIYIELITRKAAIEIDEQHDVIAEVYNSWYALFQITRDEIKKLSGNLLESSESSQQLIQIATDVLNQGLRPHMTEHQARFRRWYEAEIGNPVNKAKPPQTIQTQYPDYSNLVASMRDVNKILMNYAEVLQQFIKGNSDNSSI